MLPLKCVGVGAAKNLKEVHVQCLSVRGEKLLCAECAGVPKLTAHKYPDKKLPLTPFHMNWGFRLTPFGSIYDIIAFTTLPSIQNNRNLNAWKNLACYLTPDLVLRWFFYLF